MNRPSAGDPILFYDGVCGLCNHLNRFVLAHDRAGQFRFAALQSRFASEVLTRHGKDPADLDTFYLLENYGASNERLHAKARAGLRVLERIGGPWSASRAFAWLPTAWLDAIYDLVARTRYRIFGRSAECRVPPPEHRRRFIEYE